MFSPVANKLSRPVKLTFTGPSDLSAVRKVIIGIGNGTTGVRFRYGKWEARIRVDGKLISLGRFSSKEEAGQAYNEAAKRFFGEYAVNA